MVVACGWVTLEHPNSAFPALWWYIIPPPRLLFRCWPVDRSVSVWGWRRVTDMRSSLKPFSLPRLPGPRACFSTAVCSISDLLLWRLQHQGAADCFCSLCCHKPGAVNFMLTQTARRTTTVGLMQLRHATNGRFPFCIVLLCCAHVHSRC